VNLFTTLTGADVTASDDLTGAARQGGDWNLEYSTGSIEAGLAVTRSRLSPVPVGTRYSWPPSNTRKTKTTPV
jgi:hypothetical protein